MPAQSLHTHVNQGVALAPSSAMAPDFAIEVARAASHVERRLRGALASKDERYEAAVLRVATVLRQLGEGAASDTGSGFRPDPVESHVLLNAYCRPVGAARIQTFEQLAERLNETSADLIAVLECRLHDPDRLTVLRDFLIALSDEAAIERHRFNRLQSRANTSVVHLI